MAIVLDGALLDWTADDRLEPPAARIPGYALYGRLEADTFYIALSSAQPIDATSTFWLNTDADTSTGHQVWGFASGAEFNVNFTAAGVPRLYTGADGETLVSAITYAMSADRKVLEIALPKSLLGASVSSVGIMADVNNAVFLPADYSNAAYVITAPVAGPYDGLLTEWTPAQRLDDAASGVAGYELYGAVNGDKFVFALKSAVAIGPNTTFWLNTDADVATGHQIFGFAGGAEFNVNIGTDGIARLYSGGAGQTLIGEIDYKIASDGLSMEFDVPRSLIGASVTAVTLLVDVNDTIFLPTTYANGGYTLVDPGAIPASQFDGVLGEWTASQRLETPMTTINGYEFYGEFSDGNFNFGFKSAVAIGPNTTFWLNTDGNAATGTQVFGYAGGAEFNVNIGTDGVARLYSGNAGQTLVGTIDYKVGPDGKTIEFAVPKAMLGAAVSSVSVLADVNDSVYLPANYLSPAYTVYDPASLPAVTDTGNKVAIVYSQSTAQNYFSEMAYSQLVMAAQSQAMAAGIPFDLVSEADLADLSKMVNYDTIIFPSFRNVPANYAVIQDVLTKLVYQYDVSLIAAGDFMTNDASGASLPNNAYERMQTLFGLNRTGGATGVTIEIQATAGGHPITDGYGPGGTIHTYTGADTSYFTAANPAAGSVSVIAEQAVNGVAHGAVLGTVTGGRNVHFSTDALLGDVNLLGQAIDWVSEETGGPTVSLHMTRNASIFASRNDMDQSQETYDVDGGIYDAMLPILQQWKTDYNFVGSYYVNVGFNPPDQETNWLISSPYYSAMRAMGNEIGSHSYSHPEDTNLLLPDVLTQELLTQRIAQYAAQAGGPGVVGEALAAMTLAQVNAKLAQVLAAPDPEALDATSKAFLAATYTFQFATARAVLEANLGYPIGGAAVPGMPEGLLPAQQIMQYYDYLSGGASMLGAGYPGAIGYLTPGDDGKVYIAPNMSFDFTLMGWLGLDVAQAQAKWAAEWADLNANSDMPIVVWPWHDYGVTTWTLDEGVPSPYSAAMFTNFIAAAHAAGTEFVTLADLAARIKAFEQAEFGFSVAGDLITVHATPQSGQLGTFALDLDDLGGKTIKSVTNWYAYDDNSVFLDADGGTFQVQLGATADEVTHITAIGSRAQLMSLTGDGANLDFTIFGEGRVVVDVKQGVGYLYQTTGATVISHVGDILTLDLGAFGSHSVAIRQVPYNVAPTDIVVSNQIDVPENTTTRIKVADLAVIDPNVDPLLRMNVVTVSDARFEIDAATGALYLKAGQALDFEATPSIEMTLTSSDGALTYSKPITITVGNVNEGPTDIVVTNQVAVPENTLVRTKVADLAVTDPDLVAGFRNNVVTVSDARFEIDGATGALYLKAGQAVDFETAPTVTMTLTATDGALTHSEPITITVGNVNEAPTDIVITNQAVLQENNLLRTKVADLAVTDPDLVAGFRNNVVTVSDARFEIDGATGALYLKAGQAINFEATPTIAMTLKTTDGALTYSKPITVSIGNVNEAPTAIVVTNQVGVTENSLLRTKVADLAVTDPDLVAAFRNNVVTVSDARFEIDAPTGALYLKAGQAIDYETTKTIALTVKATDGALTVSKALTLTVLNANDRPTGLPTISGTAIENGTLTASASLIRDADGLGAFTYQWQRGSGTAFTNIAGATAATYRPVQADTNQQLRVSVSYRDGGATTETVVSAATSKVVDVLPTTTLAALPANTSRIITAAELIGAGLTGAVTITSLTASIGTLVAAGAGRWTYTPPLNNETAVTFAYAAMAGTKPAQGTAAMDLVTSNTMHGTAGADNLGARNNPDTYCGFAGNDTISAGIGNDTIYGNEGNDTALGGADNDVFVATVGDGNDRYTGDAGTDRYDLSGTSARGNVNLTTGVASSAQTGTDTLVTIENVTGGSGADTIWGSALANVLDGGAGNDVLLGMAGNDTILGGTGNDTIYDYEGNDTVSGGADNDVFVAAVGDGNDRYTGDAGTDRYHLSNASVAVTVNLTTGIASSTQTGTDTLVTIENVTGGSGADSITGSALVNVLDGGAGNDVLLGMAGNDTLLGGAGNDRLTGGAGRDVMTGGANNDTFIFAALSETRTTTTTRDIITDFTRGQDVFNFAAIDANPSVAGDQAFSFLVAQGAAFTGARGQIRWVQENPAGAVNDKTIVMGDLNGDRVADFHVELTGLINLGASDFAL